jgi:hypothetical protein
MARGECIGIVEVFTQNWGAFNQNAIERYQIELLSPGISYIIIRY